MSCELIATIPPMAGHSPDIARHPLVNELRFNTIRPVMPSKKDVLARLVDICENKPLWLDLKARQLRIQRWCEPLYARVKLSHRITVRPGAEILFKSGKGIIAGVDGDEIVLTDVPDSSLGDGQPVNILDPSLIIHGFLTDDDVDYVSLGLVHRHMLSFCELPADISEVLALDPQAEIIAKIESRAGLAACRQLVSQSHLMAARDDLFINMGDQKFDIIEAEEAIISTDRRAIAASRIFVSLERGSTISHSDIKDIVSLYRMGYRRFMLSDGICDNWQVFSKVMEVYEQFLGWVEKQ